MIGDSIQITILEVDGDRVKLGIAAPREIPILRHEVFSAILDQNKIEEQLLTAPEPESFQALRNLLTGKEASGAEDGEPEEPQK